MNEEKMKDVAVRVNDLFSALDGLSDDDLKNLTSSNSGVVDLRGTKNFNVSLASLSGDDVKSLRRNLVAAIATEKYVDGFIMAIQLLSLFGAI